MESFSEPDIFFPTNVQAREEKRNRKEKTSEGKRIERKRQRHVMNQEYEQQGEKIIDLNEIGLLPLTDCQEQQKKHQQKKEEREKKRRGYREKLLTSQDNQCQDKKVAEGGDILDYPCTEDQQNHSLLTKSQQQQKLGIRSLTEPQKQINSTKACTSKVPSLCECAKLLKAKATIVCIENRLYYYNGCCYEALDRNTLIMLYREKVSGDLHNAGNMNLFHQLYNYFLTDPEIQKKVEMAKLSNLSILRNGIYNVKKGKLGSFDASIMAFSSIDASYVEDDACPVFENFLKDVTGGDEVLVERMWMFLGYVFTLSLDAKVFFVLGYAPNSGKSLLGKFLEKLYAPQYVSSIALTDFNGEFSLGTLAGKAVNISLDLPNSKLSVAAVSKLKMLTGDDLITINEKYVPQYKYRNQAKFIFASNYPIQLVRDDEAFWERMIFLPFDYSVNKADQDAGLLKKFLKEKDVIVSKALRYAGKLMENHYIFPTTEAIERHIMKCRGIEVDTIGGFLEERCNIGGDYKGETIADLYLSYVAYCKEEGELVQEKNKFKDFLQNQVGLKHCKLRLGGCENPRSSFRGIQLLNANEERG